MSFIPDCPRSAKRLPQGKSLLERVKDTGIPCATVIKNGFTIKALSLDGIEKINITAPAGLVVLCSHSGGISTCSNEYWLEAISPPRDVHIIDPYPPIVEEFPYSKSYNFTIYTGNVGATNSKAEPAINADRSFCVPSIVPLYDSEALFFAVSFLQDLEDTPYSYVDGEGATVWLANQFRQELFIDAYGGVGKRDFPAGTVRGADYVYYSNSWTTQICLNNAFVEFYGSNRLMYDGSEYFTTALAWVTKALGPKDIQSVVLGPFDAWTGLPEELYIAISGLQNQNNVNLYVQILGSYACTVDGNLTILTVCLNTPLGFPIWEWYRSETSSEHPINRQWRLFYSIYTEGVGSIVVPGYDIFKTLCDIHAVPDQTNVEYVNWSFIEDAMSQLVPFPNVNHYNQTPHDSIMFHGPDGIYTWTRNNGRVRFSPTGLEIVSMTVPSEVASTNGVRPVITYGGTFEGTDYYLCVCQEPGKEVKATYVGSPFSGEWSKLPDINDHTIQHIQPLMANEKGVVLLGIAKRTEDGKHFVSFLSRKGGVGEWRLLSEVEAPAGADHKWAMSLYGDESITQLQRNYPSQPAATVQPWHLGSYPPVTF